MSDADATFEASDSRPRDAPRRVLLVRPSALGDVSRTVPLAVSLKRAWPDAEVHWLVNEGFEPAIEGHPDVDRVVSFPRKRLAKFGKRWHATKQGLNFARTLRRAGYDRVYDAQGLFRSGLFAWLTRAPRRVGFADAREMGHLGCNVRHRVSADVRHTVDRMLALLEADGVEPVRDLSLHLRKADVERAERFVEAHGLRTGYFVVAPTARWASKCWPAARFAEVTARVLHARPDWKAVILAAPDERPQANAMLDALAHHGLDTDPRQRRVIQPDTTVADLMAILSRCELLLCNDSAPLHIAVGFDRRVVTIYGPTDPAEVGPYGRRDDVVCPDVDEHERRRYARDRTDPTLIERVGVEDVWTRVQPRLA